MRVALKPLGKQVVVITGATSGIGLATARGAAAAGARVMLVARNAEALREIGNELGAAYAVADVGDAAQVQAAADAAMAAYGRIDSWVSNAGVAAYSRLMDLPLAEHERLFRTNYFGAVNSAAAAVTALARQGGTLLFTGSIAGELPSPILGAYAASKHALHGFVESLRMELEADGMPVSVTLVKPSGIDTPIAQHAAAHVQGVPMVPQPAYKPELVARAILDALQHPRREVVVGGAGLAQVLLGTHFPRLLDRFAPVLERMLVARGPSRSSGGNLFHSAPDRRVHSGDTPALRHSMHDALVRHRGPALLGVLALTALVAHAAHKRGI